jgi:hypothetical protein
MKPLKLEECEIVLAMEPCCDRLEGNVSCIDDETDAANVAYVREQLEAGNDWAWCDVTVTLHYRGMQASDSLCQCSYKSRADFEAPGGYYDDMVHTCLSELNVALLAVCKERC